MSKKENCFMRLAIFALLLAVVAASCDDEPVAVPKPRAYPRVIYPAKAYQPFESAYCPFSFDMPAYATIARDTTFFEKRPESDCWFNVDIQPLNATIYCSYYPIASRQRFDELVEDAFTMTQKHNIKASYIEETPIHRPADRVHGLIFEVEGPAASAYQFFLTDSTEHFLRGALYFNTQARPDSLAPVIDFVKQDLTRMVETLRWK
jgi:gliding motility-associated lipoprotein GldD